MDPYLESPLFWHGMHTCLIAAIQAALQPMLRPKYNARIEVRLAILPSGRSIVPDVAIEARSVREAAGSYDANRTTTLEPPADRPPADPSLASPWIVRLGEQPPPQRYIEIISTATREVVTVIEALSPSNKTRADGIEDYARKRRDILASQVNLVEIDLLAQGIRPLPQPADCDPARCRYAIGVSRALHRAAYELYPIALGERLPRFGVPVQFPDPDVPLDLQAVLDRCYEDGAYGDLIDYAQPPSAVLTEAERAVMVGVLKPA
jgi:hypothetical protein